MANPKSNNNVVNKTINFSRCQIPNLELNQYSHQADNISESEHIIFDASLNIDVIGRSKEVDEIYDLFKNHKRVAITGIAGVGKTSLSLYFIQKWHKNNWIKNIIFLNCEKIVYLKTSFDKLANNLNIDPSDKIGFLQTKNKIFAKLDKEISFYICDNVENTNIILEVLPSHDLNNSYFIFTSQITDSCLWEELCKFYYLGMLQFDEARKLISKKLKYEGNIENQKIIDLNDKFDGYPLGLLQAISSINYTIKDPHNDYTINEIIDDYLGELKTKLNELPDTWACLTNAVKYNKTVKAAISINYEKIQENKKYIEKSDFKKIIDLIILLLVFAVPDTIHSSLILDLDQYEFTKNDVKEALRLISVKYSIINEDKRRCLQHDKQCNFLHMHRMIKSVLRENFKNKEIIKIMCIIKQYFNFNMDIEHFKFLYSHINENTIFYCSENEWESHCSNICSTPDAIPLIESLLEAFKNKRKSSKYLRTLCIYLSKNINVAVYKWCLSYNDNIFKVFLNVLKEEQLSINTWNKEYERLILTCCTLNIIEDILKWRNIQWITWTGSIDKLKKIPIEQILFRCMDGWSVLHVGAITGNVEILTLFTTEEIKKIIDIRAGKLKMTAVMLAVVFKNTEYLSFLLDNNCDVNIVNNTGRSALHYTDDINVAKLLIDKKIDVNLLDAEGASALHISIDKGKIDIVKLLIENGANVNQRKLNRETPWSISLREGQFEIIGLLINHKIDFTLLDNFGKIHSFLLDKTKLTNTKIPWSISENSLSHLEKYIFDLVISINSSEIAEYIYTCGSEFKFFYHPETILQLALDKCNLKVIQVLINHCKNLDLLKKFYKTLLYWAQHAGVLDCEHLTLDFDSDINISDDVGNNIIHWAGRIGEIKIIQVILSHGIEINTVNKQGNSPLHICVENGHYYIVKILLDKGAEIDCINTIGKTPLDIAIQKHYLEISQLLLNHGANIFPYYENRIRHFHMAARDGIINSVKLRLANNLDINVTDEKGYTALHHAAVNGKTDVVEYLLNQQINVNKKNQLGATALHLSVESDNVKTVQILLKHGALINIVDQNGESALHRSAFLGKPHITKYLLQNFAEINLQNKIGVTPLHHAVKSNSVETFKILLDYKADTNLLNNIGLSALHWSAEDGRIEMIKYFLQNGANINFKNKRGITPLYWSIKNNSIETTKYLLDHGADFNILTEEGESVLHRSITLKKIDMTKLLLESGVEVNIKDKYDCTPLHQAIFYKDREAVKLLLDFKADINLENESKDNALQLCARYNEPEIAKLLLKNGANVNFQSYYGCTSLHVSVGYNGLTLARILIEHGININLTDNDGDTALNYSAELNNIEMAKLLLSHKADVNINSLIQGTSLQWAARNSKPEMIQLLLEHNAEVNHQSKYGITALHWAVWKEELDTIRLLLQHSANINLKNIYNETPLHWAVQSGKTEIVKLLLTNLSNETKESIIELAVRCNNLEIVELLNRNSMSCIIS